MKFWIKKRWKDLALILAIGLLFVPQIRQPLQVFVQGIFAGSPDDLDKNQQQQLNDFQFALRDLNGVSTNLSKSEGRVVIINNWATWCAPCIAEMPSLQTLYNDYKDKVDFYFISYEKKNVLVQWLKEKSYDLPIFQPVGPTPGQLNSSSIPTTYVITKKGKIVIEEVGAHDWNSQEFRKKLNSMLIN